LKNESVDYYRARARDERKAARNAACDEARQAHSEMAEAYSRLVDLAELEEAGELAPGKVTTMADALHDRDETEYGGHTPKGPRPR
jgi:hypothetical protein